MSENKVVSYEKLAVILVWIGLIVIPLPAIIIIFTHNDLISTNLITVKLIDYVIGITGSIWALAGVFLFYEAMKFQRKEIVLQRKEMEYQRGEMYKHANEFAKRNELALEGHFYNIMFKLISLYNEIVNHISISVKNGDTEKEVSGRHSFPDFIQQFKLIYYDKVDTLGLISLTEEEVIVLLRTCFEEFFDKYQADLGHYFRNIQDILEFIDDYDISNKDFYIKLFLSQLSNFELVLIFYSCFHPESHSVVKNVKKYNIFKKLPDSELIDIRHKNLL